MQNFPEEQFNRRRFLKAGMASITRTGLSQAFAQTNYGQKPQQPKRKPKDGDTGSGSGGIIRL
jgi:hypothetical protein